MGVIPCRPWGGGVGSGRRERNASTATAPAAQNRTSPPRPVMTITRPRPAAAAPINTPAQTTDRKAPLRLDPEPRPVSARTIVSSPRRPVTIRQSATAQFQSHGDTPIPFSPRTTYTEATSMVTAATSNRIVDPTPRALCLRIAPHPVQLHLDEPERECDADGSRERERDSDSLHEGGGAEQLRGDH
jgi:hypothetical protein